MYIVGNATTLRASPKGQNAWIPLLQMMQAQHRLVKSFPTICQLHPRAPVVQCLSVKDFRLKHPNGGCLEPCSARLDCGHSCPLMCHPTDPNHQVTHKQCVQPCRRTPKGCNRSHSCSRLCNQPCGPCDEIVEDTLLPCDHVAMTPTCHSVRDMNAIAELSKRCSTEVTFTFSPCGHTTSTTCGNANSDEPVCSATCGKILQCGHPCQNE